MKGRWILTGIKWMLFIAAGAFLFGWVTMLLWNALVPVLFNGPAISFWQAAGLLILSRLLLGGRWGRWRHRWHGKAHWRHRMNEKVANMTPEQRQEFMARMRHCCGSWAKPEEETTAVNS